MPSLKGGGAAPHIAPTASVPRKLLRLIRVVATTDAENAPAAALFARLGFRCEAHHIKNVWFKGRWGDELLFAMLAEEWEKARKDASR
jgi:RimJ/RimL family protein N-acetyltransferase